MPSRPTCLLTPLRRYWHVTAIAPGTRLACLSLALLLAGCAAQTAYRDGKALVAQDKVEQGLRKFQEAMAAEPQNNEYKAAFIQTRERAANAHTQQADALAAAGRPAEAQALYQRALALDPHHERARAGLTALERAHRHAQLLAEARSALEGSDPELAQAKLHAILSENPQHAAALALRNSIKEKPVKPAADAALSASYKKPISIEFRDAQIRQIFEVIALSSGLNFVFDKDVKTDQKTSIFLKNSTVESAIYMLLLTNQLEQQVLDGNTILIYPNTAAKQKDYQELVVKSFFLANADAKTVANTVKTIVKSRDIVIDEKLNMVIVRDSPEAIRLVEKLVALHDAPEPEVMLEVEILEVKRSRLLNLGIQWPSAMGLSILPPPSGVLTWHDFSNNINASRIGVGIGGVAIRAQKDDADTNLLANPRIRTRNREKARIVIGEKVPIISTTTQLNGGSPITSEMITYVDVGLKLEVEPTIYLDNDVAIKVGLEVSNLGAEVPTKSGSSAYRIGTRNATTVLRLKDGENQVLAGLINDEDRKSASKVPGLGEIPLLGRLFGSALDNNDKTEILLSITPRIIRNILRPASAQSEFRSGTDTSLRSPPDSSARLALPPPARLDTGNTGPTRMPVAAAGNAAPAGPGAAIGQPATPGAPMITGKQAYLELTGPTQLKVGDQLEVQLVMESQQPVAGLSMSIAFDQQALQPVGMTEGEFLKQGGASTTFTSEVDPAGKVSVKAARKGASAMHGATGPGVVAHLRFRAIATSNDARVHVLSITPVDAGQQPVGMPAAAPHVVSIQR